MGSFRSRSPRRSGWRRILAALFVVIALLALFRAVLPVLVRWQVNQRLAAIDGFEGSVDGIDVALWRGGYQLQGLDLRRFVDADFEPFLKAELIDFSISWRALFEGRIHSEIDARNVHLIYIPVDEEARTADLDRPAWEDVIQDIFPIDIARLEIREGWVEYRDREAEPPVDLSLRDLKLTATGLSNRAPEKNELESKELPAWLEATGTTVGGGRAELRVSAAPLAPEPLFDLDLAIENVSLPALNDYLRAYSNVDVSGGNLRLYLEVAARDGAFEGYVKPLFDNLDFSEMEGAPDEGLAESLWEGFIDFVATIFQYPPRDQVGTRIPISGEFGDADLGLWAAVGNLFRHSFIDALSQQLEGLTLQEAEPAENVGGDNEETADEETDEGSDGGRPLADEGLRPPGPPSRVGR